MAVVNFKDRITDLAGGVVPEDDNALDQWVLDGCYDVIDKVGPKMIERFMTSSTSTSAVAQSLSGIRQIIKCDREGYPARNVSPELRKDIADATSMYYVSDITDPVWYIHKDTLYIKPTVTAAGGGATWYYIPNYSTNNMASGTSSIADFPEDYYKHVCIYAAVKVVERRLLDLKEDLPNSISLPPLPVLPSPIQAQELPQGTHVALPTFPDLQTPVLNIDIGAVKPGALYWLETEEDTDLLSGYMSIVDKQITQYDKELEIFKLKYDKALEQWSKEVELLHKNAEYEDKYIDRVLKQFDNDVRRYTEEMSTYTAELTYYTNNVAGLEKVFTQEKDVIIKKYEWLSQHHKVLKTSYIELFGGGQAPQQAQGGN